jgi:hypothetical protein
MLSPFGSLIERRLQKRSAEFVSFDVRDMDGPELPGGVCHSGVVSRKHDFHSLAEPQPALDSISLYDFGMAAKAFGNGEYRDHDFVWDCMLFVSAPI